jgi:hypothetical protein
MFEFLGKMMGISLRTHASLPFQLPALIYKALSEQVGFFSPCVRAIRVLRNRLTRAFCVQEVTLADLDGVDSMFVQVR